jgi:small-conductance mechanosensitive channel
MANSTETEIALVKNEVNQMGQLFLKLENALDKITEVCNNIGQMLAVHDERLNNQEDYADELKEQIEMHRKEHQADIKELHSRLTTAQREISKQNQVDIEKVLASIESLKMDVSGRMSEQDRRISSLEKWRWIVVGAVIITGFAIPIIVEFLQISS